MELFDAFDENGNALGFEIVRGDTIPKGFIIKLFKYIPSMKIIEY